MHGADPYGVLVGADTVLAERHHRDVVLGGQPVRELLGGAAVGHGDGHRGVGRAMRVVALLDENGHRPHLARTVGGAPELRGESCEHGPVAVERVVLGVQVVEGHTGDQAVGTAEDLACGAVVEGEAT